VLNLEVQSDKIRQGERKQTKVSFNPCMKINPIENIPVAVVGAGAAGVMAAIFAAAGGCRVALLERTADGGRKILISGGGRCNILPSAVDPAQFVTASSFHTMRNILRSWPLEQQRRYFEQKAGIALVLEEETGKLFPASDSAREVRKKLFGLAASTGAEIQFGSFVTALETCTTSNAWLLSLAGGRKLSAKAVILASGGLSVPSTGSDGVGLELARRLGHTIHTTYPALTPLTLEPPIHSALAGVSMQVMLVAPSSKRVFRTQGGFLFTHRGYSGPAVLNISHLAVQSRQRGGRKQPIHVQWCGLDTSGWEKLLGPAPGSVLSLLRRHLPSRLAERLMIEAKVEASRSQAQLRKDERRHLVELLTRYPLPWTGDEGYKKAEVTGGGVALEEIEPRTLQSRLRGGLFLCGEMLDAFGPIGGYNFLWAWATGRAAGLGAAEYVKRGG